jgi:sn-glycerol 3-phosphate transport system permease protein
MERRTYFPGLLLPAALVAPQLLLTFVFFFWPAGQAVYSSLTREDAFGLRAQFVGLDNYTDLFADPLYIDSILRTITYCASVTALSLVIALTLAIFADRELSGRNIYRTLLIWPYAVAPAIAAVLWILLVNPQIGIAASTLNAILSPFGLHWDYKLDGGQAMLVVILAAAWKQVSYNFIFFLAGLQSIPRSIIEAARLDGARSWHRLRTITLPLLAPTIFFLIIVDLVYAAFETFGTILALTQGGPGKSTETLVVKVYRDGFINLDIGSSSAQSVVLMLAVIVLTALQFRFLGRRAST